MKASNLATILAIILGMFEAKAHADKQGSRLSADLWIDDVACMSDGRGTCTRTVPVNTIYTQFKLDGLLFTSWAE